MEQLQTPSPSHVTRTDERRWGAVSNEVTVRGLASFIRFDRRFRVNCGGASTRAFTTTSRGLTEFSKLQNSCSYSSQITTS